MLKELDILNTSPKLKPVRFGQLCVPIRPGNAHADGRKEEAARDRGITTVALGGAAPCRGAPRGVFHGSAICQNSESSCN